MVSKTTYQLLGTRTNPDWRATLHNLNSSPIDRINMVLARLIFQATIYPIWLDKTEASDISKLATQFGTLRLIDEAISGKLASYTSYEHLQLEALIAWFHHLQPKCSILLDTIISLACSIFRFSPLYITFSSFLFN